MAAKAKARNKTKGRSAARKSNGQYKKKGRASNPGTKVIVIGPKQASNRKKPKSNPHRPRRNPDFFGSNIKPIQIGQYVLGGLVGVTVNRLLLPIVAQAVPTLASNNALATLTAFGVAALEWWAASYIDKSFGAAVGFGAMMNAATQGLNAFIPSVGTVIGLSGRRGQGDMVPARYTVPQNPILDAGVSGGGMSMRSAYPAAYALAA